jgi:hypothetical protein
VEKTTVEITTKTPGKTTSDEETPQSVDQAISREIGQAIDPGVACGKVHQEKAVFVPAWPDPLTVADVGTNRVSGPRRFGNRTPPGAPIDIDRVPNGERRLPVSGQMESVPEIFQGSIIKFATSKETVQLSRAVFGLGGTRGFGNIVGWELTGVGRGAMVECREVGSVGT